MVNNNFASTSKCSKPKNEFCRIHNPAPKSSPQEVSKNSQESKEAFLSSFGVNLAAQVTPPVEAEQALVKVKAAEQAHNQNPKDNEARYQYFAAKQDYARTLEGVKDLQRRTVEARDALYAAGKARGIHPADLTMYVFGYAEGIAPVEELVKLDKEYNYLAMEFNEASEARSRKLSQYKKDMLTAEFPDPEENKIADFAALNRFTFYEAEDSEAQMDETYKTFGYTRKEFFEHTNTPEFSRKLRNVEEAYIKVASGNKASKETLNKMQAERKLRIDNSPQQEDIDRTADMAFYATNYSMTQN